MSGMSIGVTVCTGLAALGLLSLAFNMILEWQLKRRTTELAAQNARLRNVHAGALRMERLNTAGYLAGAIAHDFNNILAPILGSVELLLADTATLMSDETRLRNGLETISRSAWDGATIVKRMRVFYDRRETLRIEPLTIQALLADVEDLCLPLLKGTGIAIVHREQAVPAVLADAVELRDALLAIIENAIEAMPEGGVLTLATASVDGRIELAIEDTGLGMTPATLAQCLQPFFTTKEHGGTGMGLTAALHAVRRYGGTLAVASELGGGTRVTISLPAGNARAEAVIPSEARPA